MSATSERMINYLLVEDNDSHAEIVEKCFKFQKLASEVRRVKTGTDCLAYLAGEKMFADRSQYPYPDVMLLDIHMPGILDGLQTLKAIRADSRHSSLSVMMLTSSERDLDVNLAYKLGANGYIVKSDDTDKMLEKLMQLQHSFETLLQLPRQTQKSALDSEVEIQRESASPGPVDPFVECDQDDIFDTLVSKYKKNRDETVELFKAMEQVSASHFANLASRFCMEERHSFAGGEDVDWVFIREVMMDRLPRYTSLNKMAGLVNIITAVLEDNPAARLDNSSWQLWQGFCRAYLNQEMESPTEADDEPQEALPWLTQHWKNIAIGAIIVLFALLLGVIIREFI